MFVSARSLEAFYAGPQGQKLARECAAALARLTPPGKEDAVMGFGYTKPYLEAFARRSRSCRAFMPAALAGGESGAAEEAGKSRRAKAAGSAKTPNAASADSAASARPVVQEEERKFPLDDAAIDCILAVHALEFSPDAQATLRELWRVLAPNGRLILAVPNRRGLWAHKEKTPFGHGEPYSRGQLAQMLAHNGFECASIQEYVHFWPQQSPRFPLLGRAYERLARRFFPYFGGVLLAEAHKRLYSPLLTAKARLRPHFLADFAPQPALRARQERCRGKSGA